MTWGTEEGLAQLFGDGASEIRARRRDHVFHYRSPEHWVEVFRTWYGPIHLAFQALAPEAWPALQQALTDLLAEGNAASGGALAAPATYLEVVIARR